MLQNVQDIIARVGVLVDDPTGSFATTDYVTPFVDQEYAKLDVELERLGLQYVEAIAVFDVDAGVSDLSSFAAGTGASAGPLAAMKLPKRVQWKLQGEIDVTYEDSMFVDELEDVYNSSYGAQQWRNADGNIQITPSSEAITLRVYYEQISTTMLDPAQNVIRGSAHILAERVASVIMWTRGNNALAQNLEKRAYASWNAFCLVFQMQQQAKQYHPPTLHRRSNNRRGGSFYVQASQT